MKARQPEDLDVPLSKKEEDDIDPGKNILRLSLILAFFFMLLVLLRYTLGDQLEFYGAELVHRFGYPGMFVATLLMDTFIVPISPDIILFVTIAGDVDIFWSLFTITFASMIGGNLGYLIGRFLGNRKFILERIAPFERRGRYLMKKYGLWAVIIGAMTPIPFSAVCWLAGMLKMRYFRFMAGVLWRIPRFLLWYIILAMGFKGIAW